MIETAKISVTTTGSAGSASGTGYSARPLNGDLLALYVDYNGSAPATTDITITVESDGSHPAVTLYSKSDSATDAWAYPKVQSTDTGGSAIAAEYQHIAVAGRISVALAQCDALTDAAVVYAYLRC